HLGRRRRRRPADRGRRAPARSVAEDLGLLEMQRVKLLLFDVDGVLTDGTILVHGDGSESKQFNIKAGAAMVWAQRAGRRIGLLSARSAEATAIRAAQLGLSVVVQGSANKLAGYEQILADQGLGDAEVGYMGDDL